MNNSVNGCRGEGLAFQKKVGDNSDPFKIEKTFILESSGVANKLAELMQDTSEVYLDLPYKILELAKSHLTYNLSHYLRYYKQEFQVGLQALAIVEKDTGVRLAEDEAASIALHFVNS